jgi:hypothetical protein
LLRLTLASDDRTDDSFRASASMRALRSLICPLMRLSLCSKSETFWDDAVEAEGEVEAAEEEEGWAWTEDPGEGRRESAARPPDPPGKERKAIAARSAVASGSWRVLFIRSIVSGLL